MNKIEKGKKAVLGIGIGIIVLSIAGFALSIYLLISGSLGVALGAVSANNIAKLVCGAIIVLLSMPGIGVGIYFTWVGAAIVATHGSIADGDLCKGTINMNKCENCGSEIAKEDKCCGSCGKSVEKIKVCPNCKTENSSRKRKCTNCGSDLK